MKDNFTDIDDLILRYLAGETNSDEDERLQVWIKADAKNRERFNRKRELWLSAMDGSTLTQYDWQNAFSSFRSWRDRYEAKSVRRRRFIKLLGGVAAACLLVLIVSYLSFRSGKSYMSREFAQIRIEAPAGSNVKTVLPDGTVVTLNSCSYITYSQGFGLKDRNVRLHGEGYFDVRKNTGLPFVIETGSLLVEDLGTKFNISDYADEDKAVLQLDEGKVSMQGRSGDRRKYYLEPNQTAVFDKSSGTMTVASSVKSASHLWAAGKIVFDGAPLATVKNKLERAYGVKITISSGNLYRYRFHGEFDRNSQTVGDVLETLSLTGKIKYTIRGRDITIY